MVFGDAQDVIEFAQFLDHNHNPFACLRTDESHLNKLFVFETIQHQEAIRRLFHCERRVKFRFRSGLQTKIVSRPFAQIFFYDDTLLVNFHRIDAHVRALVIELAD